VKFSIVIAAWNGSSALRQCLQSLAIQPKAADTEVVVACNFETGDIRNLFPSLSLLKLIHVSSDATVPELRTCGIENSTGDVIALLEDHCTCDSEWVSQIINAHELPYSVIGGPVENATRARLSWAVYFYDYGKYMLPETAGVVGTLSGNNISYKRHALDEVREIYRAGFYETFVNQELQRKGHDLYLHPSAIVYHNKDYALSNAVMDCFHHGRMFAAKRVFGAPFFERAKLSAASLALPCLLPSRIVLRTFRKKRNLKNLANSFPHLLLLMTAWSCGEFCGYTWREGSSARKWK
jgi:GT2 family glycosyltransferase